MFYMFTSVKTHKISKNAIVPYSATQMFNLINNIEDYPKFLNWCSTTDILQQTSTEVIASITINKGIISETFTTINTLGDNKITMCLKDGMFKKLYGIWTFTKLNNSSTKIDLYMEFSFDNKLLDITIAPVFSKIALSQLNSFIVRAKKIYG